MYCAVPMPQSVWVWPALFLNHKILGWGTDMIEIYLLEQLQAFYEHGTLSAASRHLNISQPSLSRSMKKLEGILGVELFERQKNRIVMNETGKVAAEYAGRILKQEVEMERQVRAFDQSLHTISVGSCCPGPLMDFLPKITGRSFGRNISSAVDTEERLIQGLKNYEYNIIILPKPIATDGLYCHRYRDEQLFCSVPPLHPAASCKKVSFADMDGQSFMMYAHVGFWEEIVRSRMPKSKFYLQEDFDAVGEMAQYSELLHFASDITIRFMSSRQNGRIHVPFSDPESHIWYYLVCLEKNKSKWAGLFQSL